MGTVEAALISGMKAANQIIAKLINFSLPVAWL
jgi:hypothetical protein